MKVPTYAFIPNQLEKLEAAEAAESVYACFSFYFIVFASLLAGPYYALLGLSGP